MADGVIESAIKPVLDELGFLDVSAAHHINATGSITNQIINRIIEDELVIANLSSLNPNVMYELALRHATAKPVIHICESNTQLPFDIKDQRTIMYTNDMLGVCELKNSLKNMINQINFNEEYHDNPIYNAIKIKKVLKDVDADNPLNYIMNQLEQLKEKINNKFDIAGIRNIEQKCDTEIGIKVNPGDQVFSTLRMAEVVEKCLNEQKSIVKYTIGKYNFGDDKIFRCTVRIYQGKINEDQLKKNLMDKIIKSINVEQIYLTNVEGLW